MGIGLLYILLLSLWADLPNERWKYSEQYKTGPLVRLVLISIYIIMLKIIYTNENLLADYYSNYYSNNIDHHISNHTHERNQPGNPRVRENLRDNEPKIKLNAEIIWKIKKRYYIYNFALLVLMINQLSHEMLDPPINERYPDEYNRERLKQQ